MFTVADLQTLVGQVKAEGVICMISLSINEEQTEDALALLCQRSIRYMRENIFPLTELHNYTCTTGLFIKIIDKGKRIIQQLLASFATLFGIQAPAHADTATPIETQAALPGVEPAALVRAARTDSSYIHDHDQKHAQIHDHEMNETARAAQRAELDRRRIKGQNRAAIEADPWCTAAVISAAFQVARTNSDKSDPTGLAVWLLLKDKRHVYRAEINAIAAQLASQVDDARVDGDDPSFPNASIGNPANDDSPESREPTPPIFDESDFTGMKPIQIWQAAQGELQLQMTRATYNTWVKRTTVAGYADSHFTIAVPNDYTREWWTERLATTVTRILTGIVGSPITVEFVVWRTL